MSEEDNFVVVTRRGRRNGRRINLNGNSLASVIIEQDYEINHDRLLRTLDKAVGGIRDTSFIKFIFSRLSESLATLGSNGISEIVCYGLGRFSQNRSSRCQLAFLLCLKAQYESIRIHVYDPAFYPEEVQTLRTLGLEVIETNEEGKRVVQRDRTTLVFMPHCSRHLTNNFLYANWGDGLSSCILLANSLSKTVNNCLHKDLLNTAGYILRIHPYVTEIQLENSFMYREVFHNLNIHIFTRQNLLKVPADFWSSKEEPQYLTKDVEFVTAVQ
ncbi:PREDICTED: SRR1-like protein [Cyphomyrmex costatus]|uniref:SRR1-like protein n=1 Tax=Cyphomyrmex costatus TaxID=456900 RepID=UPI00085236AB|nr:PREDICTED: SRR1-like protein [Cyphomyrmex costatus]